MSTPSGSRTHAPSCLPRDKRARCLNLGDDGAQAAPRGRLATLRAARPSFLAPIPKDTGEEHGRCRLLHGRDRLAAAPCTFRSSSSRDPARTSRRLTRSFDAVFRSEGLEIIRTPVRSAEGQLRRPSASFAPLAPNASWILILGRRHLEQVLSPSLQQPKAAPRSTSHHPTRSDQR
jgi:hypothetical protein